LSCLQTRSLFYYRDWQVQSRTHPGQAKRPQTH